MNGSRFAEQARQLLQESLDQLNALKNANVRDTGFKQWRQNALTLIQRLCPGDSARSDRFRRVPFSPPSARADQRTTREWYERGCAEASQLMRSLLTEIEEHGVPQPMGPLPSSAPEPEEMEGDFPTVDLPGGAPAPPPQAAEPPPPPPARVERRKHPRQESPKLEETLREVTGGEAAQRRPTPKPAPKERGSVSRRVRERLKDMLGLGEMSPARAPEPEPEPESELQPDPMDHEFEPRVELPEPPLPPPARREPPAPARPARPAQREPVQREPVHREPTHREPAHREPPPRAATPPRPREDAPPPRPRHEDPAPARPKREEPPPPRRDLRAHDVDDDEPVEMIELPEFHFPGDDDLEAPAPFEDEPVEPLRGEAEDEDPFAYDDELIAEVRQVEPESIEETVEAIAEEEVEEAPLADQLPEWMRGQAAEPRRMSERRDPHEEDDASRRARARREERLDEDVVTPLPAPERPHRRESPPPRPEPPARPPAPAARPRPAERPAAQAPAGPRALTSPTAIALMGIAAQVDELGVPDGHRARTRAALLDLARQVEGRDLSWDVLREAVVFLVDYPPLARRVLPLLVPHLDQAA